MRNPTATCSPASAWSLPSSTGCYVSTVLRAAFTPLMGSPKCELSILKSNNKFISSSLEMFFFLIYKVAGGRLYICPHGDGINLTREKQRETHSWKWQPCLLMKNLGFHCSEGCRSILVCVKEDGHTSQPELWEGRFRRPNPGPAWASHWPK